MLTKIKKKLEQLELGPVKYGRVNGNPEEWNYIVFGRDKMSKAGTSRNDYKRNYRVVIVHEDYIPEGYEAQVITALNAIAGLKQSDDEIRYDYAIKNSNTIVEMAVLTFSEFIKGYSV